MIVQNRRRLVRAGLKARLGPSSPRTPSQRFCGTHLGPQVHSRIKPPRSLAETPTWSVATVTTAMVFACFLVERSIHRLGKWLHKTKRKAMLASLEKIREELIMLGLISLMLSQTVRWISETCVPSSLFSCRFYMCPEDDFSTESESGESYPLNQTDLPSTIIGVHPHDCDEGFEPFFSFEGLEQLHRFLFIGITHVLYSFFTVVLSMIKIYSWRK